MKIYKSNVDVFADDTLRFVQGHLSSNDLRILEVGCGSGDFSLRLMQAGVSLKACDTNKDSVQLCHEKGVPAVHIDFLEIRNESFDVILFTRSLHHIHQLREAIEHSNSLLVPRGMLIVEDFDLNMINANTARWYYDTRSIVSVCTNNENPTGFVEDPMKAWIDVHEHTPPLNTGDEMIKTIRDRFDKVSIERNPYLYRSICGKLNAYKEGHQITESVLKIEEGLINEQVILPNGLRIVAHKSA